MEGKNESKHTPGPWKVESYYQNDSIRKYVVQSEQSHFITDIYSQSLNAKANAELIASAPALLEVTKELIAVIKEIESNWISADHYSGSETNDKAYSAIIKANKIINGK